MSARTTFEDRLLDNLKKEIELREAEASRARVVTVATGEGKPKASARRLFTPRRIAVVAFACAVAWLGAVVVPGSLADSTAYAVKRHGDGRVTLTVKDQNIGVEAQHELAREVRPLCIEVTIDLLPAGYVCERSKVTPLPAVDRQANRVLIIPLKAGWDVTLRRGNVLAFENTGVTPDLARPSSTRARARPSPACR
ncbi:hypothetical protein [Streptomyces liliifuscus]|uniref:hypothetical protein n=1 Tax=Streptomyces liliifuscus TaxID=2797636 RepID=UPI001F1EA303|nr:hypothetical protein [Streptomyces liliifuscus]